MKSRRYKEELRESPLTKEDRRWRMTRIVNTLVRRREFLSLVECCKIVFNPNGINFCDYFELWRKTKTRSNHPYKIQTKIAKLNCWKYPFFAKIIQSRNDLSSNVIDCCDRLKNDMKNYLLNGHFIPVGDVYLCYLSDFYISLLTGFYSAFDWCLHLSLFGRSLI